MERMPRLAGILLVLVASASMALGSPVCCLVESGCCGTEHAEEAALEEGHCPHCAPEKPAKPVRPAKSAPKPCRDQHTCACKSHAPAAAVDAHAVAAPLAAIADLPVLLLDAPQTAHVPTAVFRTPPPGHAQLTLPLLL